MIDNQYKYITMATLYNKTALKKTKKDELIKLFLDKQAEMNDMELAMEKDKYDGRWPEDVQAINEKDNLIAKLQEEIKQRKEEINKMKDNLAYQKHQKILARKEINQIKEENERLKKGSEATTEKNSRLWSENTKMKTSLIKYEQLMNKLHRQTKKWENPHDC